MKTIADYVREVALYFAARLDSALVEAYQIGSLAHGGFSPVYSDIDVGLWLQSASPPQEMAKWIEAAKLLEPEVGKKLSVFWGNPACDWGRFPVLDRLDLLDHGVPLLRGHKAEFRRPAAEEIRGALLASVERSWKPQLLQLSGLQALPAAERKHYIRAILYPARLIYSWDHLAVDSNDRAVAYLERIRPKGLDLDCIARALDCRRERCAAEDVFALNVDLQRQFARTMEHLGQNSAVK